MTRLAFRSLEPLMPDPWRLARSLFEDPQPTARTDFMPRFDVLETEAEYVFEADLPGVKKENIEITLDGRTLTIAGGRERTRKVDADDTHVAERVWGRFNRSFRLPVAADAEAITADLREGVLTVTVAKKAEVKPRRVTIGTPSAPDQSPSDPS